MVITYQKVCALAYLHLGFIQSYFVRRGHCHSKRMVWALILPHNQDLTILHGGSGQCIGPHILHQQHKTFLYKPDLIILVILNILPTSMTFG